MAGEAVIRKALKARVEALGGEIRAVSWLGRRYAPDVLVLLPVGGLTPLTDRCDAHPWVEAKCIGGVLSAGQKREHERMRRAGCVVHVIWTQAQIDERFPL